MPGRRDGYLMEWVDGTWSVAFDGYRRASGLSEAEARNILKQLADGRPLWMVNDTGGAAYEPLTL